MTDLRDQYARAIRDAVRVRLGTNALRLAEDGHPVMLNMSEAEAAADAVLAVRDAARTAARQTKPTAAYTDGKGRTYCVRCVRTVEAANLPLTVDDVDHWELCANCERHVVDIARQATPARTTGHQPGTRCGHLLAGHTPGTWTDCNLPDGHDGPHTAPQTTGQDDTCTEDFRRPRCHPRHTDDCPYTDPAVGQPAFEYPRQDGDLTVLGPEAFASSDGQVISWRGLNYVPQVDNQPLAEARRDIHEALVVLPAPEADRVRALVARLETAAHAAVGQPAEAHDTDRAAILREAIEAVLGRVEAYEGMGQDAVDRNRERTAIVSMLRRMAVEGER